MANSGKREEVMMGGLAEATRVQQLNLLARTLAWCKALAESGKATLEAFIHHIKMDETPLRARVAFGRSLAGGPSGTGSFADMQTAKVHVIEGHYSILLRTTTSQGMPRHVLLKGGFAPELRASDRTTAEALFEVLKTCARPSDPLEVGKLFRCAIQVFECDGYGANPRCTRFFPQWPVWKDWHQLRHFCYAHKVHTSSTRVHDMNKPMISGLKHLGLWGSSSGVLSLLRASLRKTITEDLLVVQHASPPQLPLDAVLFREACLKSFAPPESTVTCQVLFQACRLVLNGDWRQPGLQHHCFQCCPDRESSIEKVLASQRLAKKHRGSGL